MYRVPGGYREGTGRLPRRLPGRVAAVRIFAENAPYRASKKVSARSCARPAAALRDIQFGKWMVYANWLESWLETSGSARVTLLNGPRIGAAPPFSANLADVARDSSNISKTKESFKNSACRKSWLIECQGHH